MNKSELIDHVAQAAGLDKKSAEAAVLAVFGGIMESVKAGDEVSIFGFGKFVPATNAARTGLNPQTKEPIKIAASKTAKFRIATAFKTSLNSKAKAKKATKAAKKK